MTGKKRTLYLCRHCQAMVYVETASAARLPCPRCLHRNYESVFVPVYAQATRAVRYLLEGRTG